MSGARFDRLDTYRDAYEALDACQILDTVLSRLRQQQLLDEQEWIWSSRRVAEIKGQVEGHLTRPS